MQKYTVNQHLIETILAWVYSGEIAISEIRLPFVCCALMDSLCKGVTISYFVAWQNFPIFKFEMEDWGDFLMERWGLMGEKIWGWYLGL